MYKTHVHKLVSLLGSPFPYGAPTPGAYPGQVQYPNPYPQQAYPPPPPGAQPCAFNPDMVILVLLYYLIHSLLFETRSVNLQLYCLEVL